MISRKNMNTIIAGVEIARPIKGMVNGLVRLERKVYVINYVVEPSGRCKDNMLMGPKYKV